MLSSVTFASPPRVDPRNKASTHRAHGHKGRTGTRAHLSNVHGSTSTRVRWCNDPRAHEHNGPTGPRAYGIMCPRALLAHRAHGPTGPRAHVHKDTRAHGHTSSRVHGAMGPTGPMGQMGPRLPRSSGTRAHGATSPRALCPKCTHVGVL